MTSGDVSHLAHLINAQDWARTTCCSERSFVTTTAEGEEEAGLQVDLDALSQLDAHSVLSGSDVAELLSLTDSLAAAPSTPQLPQPQPTTATPVSAKVRPLLLW